MGAEVGDVYPFEGVHRGCFEYDTWCFARRVGFAPPACTYTPTVSRFEAVEPVLGSWGYEIVALFGREFQERVGHHGANEVHSRV